MMRPTRAAILALLALTMGLYWLRPRPPQPAPPLGFIGDSITLNGVATTTARLLGTTAVNRAVSGTDTSYWLPGHAPLTEAIAAFHAAGVQRVHVMLGTNDAKEHHRSPADYRRQLTAISHALTAQGLTVVLSAPPWMRPGAYGMVTAADNRLVLAYADQIRQMAGGPPILLGDMRAYQTFAAQPNLLGDGIHPNHRGILVLAALWETTLADAE